MPRTRFFLILMASLVLAFVVYQWMRPPIARPNVLLITVDTLRADHLGVYGYTRPTSPNIDLLARSGVVFENAFTHAQLSGPSHATMLTGLYPPTHAVVGNAVPLSDDHLTLAEILGAVGFETAMFVSHRFVSDEYGFSQGFETHENHHVHTHGHSHENEEDEDEEQGLERLASVFDAAVDWLAQPKSGPFFLWLHAQHPHLSYEPPPPYDRMFGEPPASDHDLRCVETLYDHHHEKISLEADEMEYVVAQYDGEIAFVDAQLGRVFSALRSLGLDANTVVVLTADHGEMLFDNRARRVIGHGEMRRDPVLRVPLIVRSPTVLEGRRVEAMVGLIDLAPTILDLVGLRIPHRFQGSSLVGLANGEDAIIRRASHSCTFHEDGLIRLSTRTPRFKLICEKGRSSIRCNLFDLQRDRLERYNLGQNPAYREHRDRLLDSQSSWFADAADAGRLRRITPPGRTARKLLRRAGYLKDDERER